MGLSVPVSVGGVPVSVGGVPVSVGGGPPVSLGPPSVGGGPPSVGGGPPVHAGGLPQLLPQLDACSQLMNVWNAAVWPAAAHFVWSAWHAARQPLAQLVHAVWHVAPPDGLSPPVPPSPGLLLVLLLHPAATRIAGTPASKSDRKNRFAFTMSP